MAPPKIVKTTVTMQLPSKLLDRLDAYATEHYKTRTGVVTEVLVAFLENK